MNSRGATTIVTSSGARAPRKRRRNTRRSRRVQGIGASRGRLWSSTHDRSMAPIERFLCASMKSPTSSFAVALYDTRTRTRAQRASNRAQPRLRRSSAPRASLARIARHRRRSVRQRPETARDSVRLLSLGVNPDVRRRTTPRQYVLLRQPVRRVGRRRGARPGGGEKVDGGRQASGERCERRDACRCCDGATRSQGKRMRGDEEMI